MNDLYHYVGGDLSLSPSGDLQPVSDIERGKQRVLRRLMTNASDYLFQPDYGAGLGSKVGDLLNVSEWTGLVRGQMLLESVVDANKDIGVDIQTIDNGASVYVSYTDAASGSPVSLGFDVTR